MRTEKSANATRTGYSFFKVIGLAWLLKLTTTCKKNIYITTNLAEVLTHFIMNIIKLFNFLIFLALSFSACAQSGRSKTEQEINAYVDSAINVYERKFREVLNKSDTILMEQLISRVKQGGCALADSFLLNKKEYGNVFRRTLAHTMLSNDMCVEILMKNLYIEDYRVDDFQDGNIHPVYDAIVMNRENSEKVLKYFESSSILNDCVLLSKMTQNEIMTLAFLLYNVKFELDLDKYPDEKKCLKENLGVFRYYLSDFMDKK